MSTCWALCWTFASSSCCIVQCFTAQCKRLCQARGRGGWPLGQPCAHCFCATCPLLIVPSICPPFSSHATAFRHIESPACSTAATLQLSRQRQGLQRNEQHDSTTARNATQRPLSQPLITHLHTPPLLYISSPTASRMGTHGLCSVSLSGQQNRNIGILLSPWPAPLSFAPGASPWRI